VKLYSFTAATAAAFCCAVALAAPLGTPPAELADAALQSRGDGNGTTTFWGDGASYEIVQPGMTMFFLRRDDGARVGPMIRVAYVGASWIEVRSVTFTVGERIYGPFADLYDRPTRLEAAPSVFVEALLFSVDTDEKWRMLEGIAEADELGRPVVIVFEGKTRYGVEIDPVSKRATGNALRGFRAGSAH
jgi:hypothetical protein